MRRAFRTTPENRRPGRAYRSQTSSLLKARACAGDIALADKVIGIAHRVAYERGAPAPEKMHHLRTRMERELAGERREGPGHARYDLKLGRGGFVDVLVTDRSAALGLLELDPP